jgi:hypothetical protein
VIVKIIVEKQMECGLAEETEVLGENVAQRHFCPSQNPTRPDPGLNPGRRGGKSSTNRMSYGAAFRTSKDKESRYTTAEIVLWYENFCFFSPFHYAIAKI